MTPAQRATWVHDHHLNLRYGAASAAATDVANYYQQHHEIPADITTAGYSTDIAQARLPVSCRQ